MKTIQTIILEELALDWRFNEKDGGDVMLAERISNRIKKELLPEIEKLGLSEENIVIDLLNQITK